MKSWSNILEENINKKLRIKHGEERDKTGLEGQKQTGLGSGGFTQKEPTDHIHMNENTEATLQEISQFLDIWLRRMANEVKSIILSTEQQPLIEKKHGVLYYDFLSEWLPKQHKLMTQFFSKITQRQQQQQQNDENK